MYTKLCATVLLFCIITQTQAQEEKQSIFKKIKDRAKATTEQRTENTGDKVGNKIGDKVDNAVDSLLSGAWFKKKKKKNNDAAADGKVDGTSNNNTTKNENSSQSAFAVYSKFDFIPGAKILAVEDFSSDNIGDFPAKWNTNSSGEVVKLLGSNDKFLMCNGEGIWYPEYFDNLPENATIEFDLAVENETAMQTNLCFVNTQRNKSLLNYGFENLVQIVLGINTGTTDYLVNDAESQKVSGNSKTQNAYKLEEGEAGAWVHVSIWKQKSRLRIYLNEEKIWDIPRAFDETVSYKLVFTGSSYFQENKKFYLANIKMAVGLPDTRNKLLTDRKLVTNGILFELNKAIIKPESIGVIKEIATVLKENQGLRVKIIGHSSADGNDALNLVLSQKRALAVKDALVNEWGIDAGRIETDGKGSTEPIDRTNTPTGNALNRRVEFIKL